MDNEHLLAAVDLGSNSFRLSVGRVDHGDTGSHLFTIDSLKETVRLAAGLDDNNHLSDEAILRAVDVLKRFSERIQGFPPTQVRAVATNTFRVAKNRKDLLAQAEAALGYPIEVVAGPEEARLIYTGVAHELPPSEAHRLVIDIGGGSTEFIIGQGMNSLALKSLPMGCVSFTKRYFPEGKVTSKAFKQAELHARAQIQPLVKSFRRMGWDEAFGSSGTAKALVAVLEASGFSERGITMMGLRQLKKELIRYGSAASPKLLDLKADRIEVLPAGLAIMLSAFKELGITDMSPGDGALRVGVLFDMLGRKTSADIRSGTVKQYMHRYRVDTKQASRVRQLAMALYHSNAPTLPDDQKPNGTQSNLALLLGWASDLYEVGLSISQSSFHRHTAYVLEHADMPGFSKDDQVILSRLALLCHGKLSKVDLSELPVEQWRAILCLRLALIFYRKRQTILIEGLILTIEGLDIRLTIAKRWLDNHPLTAFSLQQEQNDWQNSGFNFQLNMI